MPVILDPGDYDLTREELENAGHKTVIAASERGNALVPGVASPRRPSPWMRCARPTSTRRCLSGEADRRSTSETPMRRIAKEVYAQGRILAAICLAPVILANARVLKGMKATVAGTEAKIRMFGQNINELLRAV
jgi:putative intracellular protease/amidase